MVGDRVGVEVEAVTVVEIWGELGDVMEIVGVAIEAMCGAGEANLSARTGAGAAVGGGSGVGTGT